MRNTGVYKIKKHTFSLYVYTQLNYTRSNVSPWDKGLRRGVVWFGVFVCCEAKAAVGMEGGDPNSVNNLKRPTDWEVTIPDLPMSFAAAGQAFPIFYSP